MEEQEKKRNPELQELIGTGESLKKRILAFIQIWPTDREGLPLDLNATPIEHQEEVRRLSIEVRRWFSEINQQVIPEVRTHILT